MEADKQHNKQNVGRPLLAHLSCQGEKRVVDLLGAGDGQGAPAWRQLAREAGVQGRQLAAGQVVHNLLQTRGRPPALRSRRKSRDSDPTGQGRTELRGCLPVHRRPAPASP